MPAQRDCRSGACGRIRIFNHAHARAMAETNPSMTLIPIAKRRRGIYILPNLFTTAALFAGFYAIVQAMNDRFEYAAVAIFIAMVLDGLDGRVARLTQTQSAFGAEYDSLSDMVSFGAAPALVMYEWALQDLGKLGWIAAFIYCAGAALRLARFNTNIDVVDKRYFQGLPSPAAAALVAGMVWVVIDNGLTGEDVSWLACFLTVFAGISMVSNVFFWSGKDINLKKSVPFIVLIALVLAFALVSSYPPGVLFALFLAYAFSGYVLYGWRWMNRRRRRAEAAEAHRHEQREPGQDTEAD
ncbi:CDP-diacylglycerol--serine O-phosphatidyltransferase [Thauera sp. CAU 1555]|uniref:CDP-diacylglycerol--serine O-phosphatidyltransferase n=2 Tax=Thauera sedimentorum TaxID=2767595 RepID=A0ABR9B759_9RHOO|nr:CDP-diacylglycerol--serine O-phosphatidyltransferase [Thauera sedimentorum]MBD8502031.1 CDP-diacylglycerol--serine O-phosphatidyltransferase [Thauera sedimentorum]